MTGIPKLMLLLLESLNTKITSPINQTITFNGHYSTMFTIMARTEYIKKDTNVTSKTAFILNKYVNKKVNKK